MFRLTEIQIAGTLCSVHLKISYDFVIDIQPLCFYLMHYCSIDLTVLL